MPAGHDDGRRLECRRWAPQPFFHHHSSSHQLSTELGRAVRQRKTGGRSGWAGGEPGEISGAAHACAPGSRPNNGKTNMGRIVSLELGFGCNRINSDVALV